MLQGLLRLMELQARTSVSWQWMLAILHHSTPWKNLPTPPKHHHKIIPTRFLHYTPPHYALNLLPRWWCNLTVSQKIIERASCKGLLIERAGYRSIRLSRVSAFLGSQSNANVVDRDGIPITKDLISRRYYGSALSASVNKWNQMCFAKREVPNVRIFNPHRTCN
jgi:hypothetical protein